MDRWRHQHLAVNRHFVHMSWCGMAAFWPKSLVCALGWLLTTLGFAATCSSWYLGKLYSWNCLLWASGQVIATEVVNGMFVLEWLLTIGARCRIFSWGCYLGRWSRRMNLAACAMFLFVPLIPNWVGVIFSFVLDVMGWLWMRSQCQVKYALVSAMCS